MIAQQKELLGDRGIWLRWTLATAIGELIGFAAPALVGALAMTYGLSDAARYGPLVVAGAVEGAILGFAQALVLRRALPALRQQDWIVATMLAASLAWMLALLPTTFGAIRQLAPDVMIIGALLLGALFVSALGGAQWIVLRRHVPHAGWWVLVNAVAWPLGVIISIIGISLIPDQASFPVIIIGGVVSGTLMGLVVGAMTGGALVWLLKQPPVQAPPVHTIVQR